MHESFIYIHIYCLMTTVITCLNIVKILLDFFLVVALNPILFATAIQMEKIRPIMEEQRINTCRARGYVIAVVQRIYECTFLL